MRRTHAPSLRNSSLPSHNESIPSKNSIAINKKIGETKDEMVVTRMPMFGFLEIPDNLRKQFKIPSGCIVTEKTLELRKTKRLGAPKQFKIVRPGDLLSSFLRPQAIVPTEEEEESLDEIASSTDNNTPPYEPLVLWTDPNDPTNKIEVIPQLASKLRPHQREGVQFLFECTMGLRGFDGQGCILADDMGLGKTLMSITTMWTLLNQGFVKNESAVRKVMVVCPTSLVGNWDNEIRKWVGDTCPTFAVKSEPKKMIKAFLQSRQKGVLIVSYETQRLYNKLFENQAKSSSLLTNTTSGTSNGICDLLICDEAHKLKNAESGLAISLSALPAKKRILLSGTPMQNELTEFYNMVNFCNPNVIGSLSEFRRRYERPILAAREPDALESEVQEAAKLQKELSVIVNEFILKRGNILNAQHLPPKLVQYVSCRLTPLQEEMYERLLSSKEIRHIQEGKQTNTLNSIRQLINICSHPKLILDTYQKKLSNKEPIDDDLAAVVALIPKNAAFKAGNSQIPSKSRKLTLAPTESIDPEQSGKMAVLFRMMQAMRAMQQNERIVVVSNYTSTLDLIEIMCNQYNWPTLRLDGTVTATKRTKLVEEFNNHTSNAFAFLLSSKAGGCGINLIGGNRLVLFDPDWNPAADKQAAARIWREGQRRRCFIYRFLSTGSIEEKIIQRQLSKEGLADIVDDKEQINSFSTDELKQLFTYRKETVSDTHDTLKCRRCSFMNERQHNSSEGNVKNRLSEAQVQRCSEFIQKFEKYLQTEAYFYQKRILRREHSHDNNTTGSGTAGKESTESSLTLRLAQARIDEATSKENDQIDEIQLPFHNQFELLQSQLKENQFPNLTVFSRKQRTLIQSIEKQMIEATEEIELKKDNNPPVPEESTANDQTNHSNHEEFVNLFPSTFSIYSEFLKQWTELVPNLMTLSSSSSSSSSSSHQKEEKNNDLTVTNDSSVPQIGCPEETDFNKWSHHCYAITCDDELFAKALGDDLSLVSFVFGLEVNFSLLESRELEMKEENERKKEQFVKDLEELNRKRRKERNPTEYSEERGDEEDNDDGDGDGTKEFKPEKRKEKKKAEEKEDFAMEVVDEEQLNNHRKGKRKKAKADVEKEEKQTPKKKKLRKDTVKEKKFNDVERNEDEEEEDVVFVAANKENRANQSVLLTVGVNESRAKSSTTPKEEDGNYYFESRDDEDEDVIVIGSTRRSSRRQLLSNFAEDSDEATEVKEVPVDRDENEAICSSGSGELFELTPGSKDSRSKSKAIIPWDCAVCTFINERTTKYCYVCKEKR